MPKLVEFPKFRTHKRGGVVCYYYDMRNSGAPDVPLGTDREKAIELWRRIASGEPADGFRKAPKVSKPAPIPRSERRKMDPLRWGGLPPWARQAYMSAERRSRLRGRSEMLSIDEFRAVVARACGVCEITGIALDTSGSGRRPFAPSLDRINAAAGYVVGNVRVVCLLANQAMSEWGEAPLFSVAEAIERKRLQKVAEVSTNPTTLSA